MPVETGGSNRTAGSYKEKEVWNDVISHHKSGRRHNFYVYY